MEQTHRGPAMVGELPNDFLRSDSQLNRTQGEQGAVLETSRKWEKLEVFRSKTMNFESVKKTTECVSSVAPGP